MNEEDVEIILQTDQVEVTEPLVADYILPVATSSTLGGVKIGDNVNITSSGTISVPIASAGSAGVIKVGTGLAIDASGVLSATGDGYTLPQATKTTLGGVYVDDALNNSSVNPVQNAVVSLAIGQTNDDLTTLSGTVSGHTTTIGNLSTAVTNLGNSVTSMASDVASNTNGVSSNTSSITTINGQIVDINDDITTIGNALGQLQGNVDAVTTTYEEVVDGVDIDNTIWTAGTLSIYRRGKTGVIYSTLEGSLTIADGASEVIYTLYDSDYNPTIESVGYMMTDAGWLECVFNTSGEFTITNNTGASVSITSLKGNLPVVYI